MRVGFSGRLNPKSLYHWYISANNRLYFMALDIILGKKKKRKCHAIGDGNPIFNQ